MDEVSTQVEGQFSMSAERLWDMNHDGTWTVKQTACLLHLSLSAAYHYYNQRELTFSQLRQFIHYAPPDVAMRLCNALFGGSRIKPLCIDDALDFDGDGDVDTDDVLGHAIDALDQCSEYLKAVRGSGAPDMARFSDLTERGIRSLVASERCARMIADMNLRRGGRKKARPVSGRAVKV